MKTSHKVVLLGLTVLVGAVAVFIEVKIACVNES
jgi:hypothetical protein